MIKYSKYKNQKTIIDGIEFDSIKEANRYTELKYLLQAKEIFNLRLQPKFILQQAFKRNKKTYRKIEYLADFYYFDNKSQTHVVEDVKGMKTEVYKLKKI